MSMIKVHLDNYQGNYKPNDTVVGRLHCVFRSEKTVRGIKVRFRGAEHTEWMDTESYYNSNSKKHETRWTRFTGDHEIFEADLYVYGSGTGTTTMAPGEYTYPFSLKLPGDLPGSYDCTEGHIRYTIKGIVDRPYKFDIEDEVIYFMYSPINFNLMSRDLQEAATWSDDKTICCWCCSSGPIELDVSLPKRAYIPGEKIILNCRVSNLSNVTVDNVTAEFEQRLNYRVRHPSSKQRNESHIIASGVGSGIGAHGEHEFVMALDIPNQTPVPNFKSCKLFHVEYILKVECELPGCHMNLEVEVFPELGNIPFGQAVPSQMNHNITSGYQGSSVGSGYPGNGVGTAYPPTGNPQYPPTGNPQYPPTGNPPYPPTGNPPYPTGGNPPYPTPGAPSDIGFVNPGANGAQPPPYPPVNSPYPYPPSGKEPVFGGPPTAPGNPDDFEIIGDGPSTASGISGGPSPYNNPKAKEASGYGGGGAPSAPTDSASAPPPPSYAESTNNPNAPHPPYPQN